MRATICGLTLLVGSLAIVSSASAGEAEDKVVKAQAEAALATLVNATNEACGAKIEASVIWTGFPVADLSRYSFAGFTEPVFDALKTLCEGKKARAYVASAVKKVAVGFGGKDKRAVSVAQGTIDYRIDWDAANTGEYALKMLVLKL